MAKNQILSELYEIRARILAEHGSDLGSYMHSEFQRLESGGHPVARIEQRRICSTGTGRSKEPLPKRRSRVSGDR